MAPLQGGIPGASPLTQQYESALVAERIHKSDELVLWRQKHPSLAGPIYTFGPNSLDTAPVLSSETVIGVVSTGLLWAVEKSSGRLAWSRSFSSIAAVAVLDDLAYLSVEGRIMAVDPSTGQTRWESSSELDNDLRGHVRPSVASGRVFWANRSGSVTCADARTGTTVWRTRVPDGGGIVSSLLATDEMVIGVGNRAGVFCLGASNGDVRWIRPLSSESIWRPEKALGGVLVTLDDQMSLLRMDDGGLLTKWSWPGRMSGPCAGGEHIAFAVRCGRERSIVGGLRLTIPTQCRIVRLVEDGSIAWEVESPLRSPGITWSEESGMLFEACGGIALIEPQSGTRKHLISIAGTQLIRRPAVERGRIYATNADEEIIALQIPGM